MGIVFLYLLPYGNEMEGLVGCIPVKEPAKQGQEFRMDKGATFPHYPKRKEDHS